MLNYLGSLSEKVRWALLLAACGVFFFLWFAPMPLTEVDEARFTEASREMLKSGNYVIPTFNGEPRYRKPILIYWLQAGSMRMFGVNETAARLPSAVASTLLVLLIYGGVLRKLDRQFAQMDSKRAVTARGATFIGALTLLLMPLVTVYARAAITDATLSLFIVASLVCLLQADLQQTHRKRWYILAAISSALAVLTKGPIGLAIPGLVWITYHLLQRDLRLSARKVPWIASVLTFFVVAVPWYAATYVVDGPAFLRWFFLKEHVERYTTTMQGHGVGSSILGLFTYIPTALVLAFPISAFVVGELIKPFCGDRALSETDSVRRLRRFSCVWLGVVIGIFSLSRTQLPEYVQSVPGALAILFTINLIGRSKSKLTNRFETGLLIFFGVIWTGLLIYVLSLGKAIGRIGEEAFPHPQTAILTSIISIAGVLLVLGAIKHRISWVLCAWTVLFGAIIFGVAPVFVNSTYMPTVEMGRFLKTIPAQDGIVCYLSSRPESLVLYAQHNIIFLRRGKEDRAFADVLKNNAPTVVLTDAEGLKEVSKTKKFDVLRHVGRTYAVRLR